MAGGSLLRRLATHRHFHPSLPRKLLRLVVSSIHVPDHAHTRIRGQHTLDALRHLSGTVRHDDLARVQRVADAPSAVFRSALSSGQSATASEPSFMLSFSRNGDATEPQSR